MLREGARTRQIMFVSTSNGGRVAAAAAAPCYGYDLYKNSCFYKFLYKFLSLGLGLEAPIS
jgi:hypothetical protein